MFTNHNIKYIFEKKAANGSREREKILLGKTSLVLIFTGISTFSTLFQKLLFFCLISVILKPFIFKFSFSEN